MIGLLRMPRVNPRRQAIEMDVDLLGAERGVDQLDLLAAAARHWPDQILVEMHELEHGSLPAAPTRRAIQPNEAGGLSQARVASRSFMEISG
jgi:hypothetical protein